MATATVVAGPAPVVTMNAPATRFFWAIEEERYLALLHKSALDLGECYKKLYLTSKAVQNRYRFPAIVMSSISGLASFGTTTFPEGARIYVSIAVGCANIIIAILNTWEAFIKVAEIVNQSLMVANSFKKLADDIHCELSIPICDRETSGIIYLRDCFTRYQQLMDQAPPLDHDVPSELAVKLLRRDITEALRENRPATYSFYATRTPTEASDSRCMNDNANSDNNNNNAINDIGGSQRISPYIKTRSYIAPPSPPLSGGNNSATLATPCTILQTQQTEQTQQPLFESILSPTSSPRLPRHTEPHAEITIGQTISAPSIEEGSTSMHSNISSTSLAESNTAILSRGLRVWQQQKRRLGI